MKLSWKIMISSVLIFTMTFSLGGYLLISSFFSSAINREKNMAQEENELLYILISHSLASNSNLIRGDELNKYISSVVKQLDQKKHIIRIRNEKDTILFENEKLKDLTVEKVIIGRTERLSKIIHSSNGYLFHTSCKININNQDFIIESFRDITSIFSQREVQIKLYQKLMVVLLTITIILFSLISFWITRPITKLSKTARKITDGDLNQRADIKTRDEVGQLAADFNQMSEHLQNNILELEQAAIRQKQFTGSFAHELKTPLTSIIGYADLLRSHILDEEERLVLADRIFKEGKRIEALSFRLMDLIVIQETNIEKKSVDIKNQLNLVVSSFPTQRIKDTNINVNAQSYQLKIEPILFQSLIHNLIDNALKAITSNGDIFIKGEKVKEGYAIYIVDNGKGIPSEALSKITEAFYVVDKSRSKENSGIGLGLSICGAIMEAHNGVISIESNINKGTKVTLLFKEELL